MLKQLKNFFRTNQHLHNEVLQLKQELHLLKTDPRKILQSLTASNLQWYDYHKLPHAEIPLYEQQAEGLLRNPVFVNELNYIFSQLKDHSLRYAKKEEELRDLQIQGVFIESFKRHIEQIANPPAKTEADETIDPYAPI